MLGLRSWIGRGVQLVPQGQDFFVLRNVAHAVPIVDKAGDPSLINEYLGRHAPQLKEVDLLPVQFQHAVFGIGQTDEGQRLLMPIVSKRAGIFGTDHNHFDVAGHKFGIVLAQLRHVRAAERSGEAAVKDQKDILPTPEIGQADYAAREIGQAKLGSNLVQGYA